MPCMSAGSAPSAADHDGSRWSEKAAAARAHWIFRCAVGATTISRPGRSRELVPRGREREGRLARAGRRDREEVGLRRRDELVEGGLLPASEADGAGHGCEARAPG